PDRASQPEASDSTSLLAGSLRPKRRSDFVAPGSVYAPLAAEFGADEAEALAESSSASIASPLPPGTDAPVPASPRIERLTDLEPALKVVSGAKAGRIVALVKDETLIGRAGVQVVALRRTP